MEKVEEIWSWEKINRATARRQFVWITEACLLLAFASVLVFL